ncbi:MAG: DegT/DnrJ/EryC1/StrS family aminotransferase [Flavobacteriaceae bacterium]|nr:DegT/DnrJ/EryC1/StrS family aminotransferase [Flavobacteriaceae bacterium]MDC1459823.1 DegT/DnrJ/EryC1/StrS family aminotransferase [Flavobacteriaceae bacterium]MDG1032141.1 DegT/DnrJ/EryC1/StrS family aminotransferase [Flavobacteriaceae bacterium]MDG1344349.1 DegT/DnrJ/EryC1/StrS family aminotransferase [Flavobacteriaceae bacterium]MDG1791827.1 DegT/DnrJ/EryC1/StrS family aminotransferase [Flavobacteriaceae bacterium]|tara:strand:+ start:4182 stop:5324 length:1143 start_codon:yes stop_codon:yes gene_type:complete
MKKLQMVDLKTQYEFIKDDVDSSVLEIFKNGTFINGPSVKKFQTDLETYLNVKHVIPCANGTDALQIALMSLDLQPGDEIITSDFTFAATVEVIALLRLKPVLVDIDEETFNINCDEIQKAITSKTKAIIPVHLFGQVANMDRVMDIAKTNNLFVIEDNAQGIGSTYFSSNNTKQKSGTIGDIGTTSFFPSKNLGCYGDGGAIFTNSDDLAHTIRGIVNHGMYVRYHHDVVGVNSRLDSVQAAILSVKLPLLDFYNERRKEASLLYSKELNQNKNILTPVTKDNCQSHVFHQYTLRVLSGNRDELSKFLNDNNIPHGIYYPIPLHKQKAYTDENYNEENFKISNMMSEQVISLPMHSELDNDQIKFISNKVNEFFKAQEN